VRRIRVSRTASRRSPLYSTSRRDTRAGAPLSVSTGPRQSLSLALLRRFVEWPRDGAAAASTRNIVLLRCRWWQIVRGGRGSSRVRLSLSTCLIAVAVVVVVVVVVIVVVVVVVVVRERDVARAVFPSGEREIAATTPSLIRVARKRGAMGICRRVLRRGGCTVVDRSTRRHNGARLLAAGV